MSLVCELSVTNSLGRLTPIGRLTMRRLVSLPDGDGRDDAVSPYEVRLDGVLLTSEVQHRYGDGAWVLVRKALGQALEDAGYDDE